MLIQINWQSSPRRHVYFRFTLVPAILSWAYTGITTTWLCAFRRIIHAAPSAFTTALLGAISPSTTASYLISIFFDASPRLYAPSSIFIFIYVGPTGVSDVNSAPSPAPAVPRHVDAPAVVSKQQWYPAGQRCPGEKQRFAAAVERLVLSLARARG